MNKLTKDEIATLLLKKEEIIVGGGVFEMKRKNDMMAEYVAYGLLLVGIFIAALLIGLATGKTPKIKKPSKLSSNHFIKTRQRRAMYANKFR